MTGEHDPTLGERLGANGGVVTVSATRCRDLEECPRRHFLRWEVRLGVDDEPTDRAAHGTAVHAELHARHADPTRHGHDATVDPTGNGDPATVAAALAHLAVCPAGHAEYLGGEVELRWLSRSRSVLVAGRVDALWRHHDGTLEVRDYKTGAVPASLEDDTGALLYLLLAATHPSAPRRVRVVYEALRPDGAVLLTLEGTADRLARAHALVDDVADRMRRTRAWPAQPSPWACTHCPFRTECPHADPAVAAEGWR